MLNISLTQLQYVLAVHKARNFAKAAALCHITQPTLSMQIHKLEEEVGTLLFDRSKKPVETTEMGIKFIEQAKTVLNSFQKLTDVVRGEQNSLEGEFRIAIIPTLAPFLLPPLFSIVEKNLPHLHFHMEELQTKSAIQALFEGRIDAALLITPLNEKKLQEFPLFYEPFLLYAHENHDLLKKARVSPKDLSMHDIWLLEEGHCFRDQALELCQRRHHDLNQAQRNVYFESGNLETLRRLVDEREGYTLMPRLALGSDYLQNPLVRPFEKPLPVREVSFVVKMDFYRMPLIQLLGAELTNKIPKDMQELNSRGIKRVPLPSH